MVIRNFTICILALSDNVFLSTDIFPLQSFKNIIIVGKAFRYDEDTPNNDFYRFSKDQDEIRHHFIIISYTLHN